MSVSAPQKRQGFDTVAGLSRPVAGLSLPARGAAGVSSFFTWRVEHLWWDLGDMAGGAEWEVELRGSSVRVVLMDADNYQAYLDDEAYHFYGGFTDTTSVYLEALYDDHWYLVVDSYPDSIKVWVSQFFDD